MSQFLGFALLPVFLGVKAGNGSSRSFGFERSATVWLTGVQHRSLALGPPHGRCTRLGSLPESCRLGVLETSNPVLAKLS